MKKPTPEQLAQLRQLRSYDKFMAYLDALENDYLTCLVRESDETLLRQAQGSAYVVRELKSLIKEL